MDRATLPSEVVLPHGVFLRDLTWVEAERWLRPSCVVVLPIGPGAKEHGPHLRLNAAAVLAEYLAERIATRCDVLIAPPIPYLYDPLFAEYPGSPSVRLETARDLVIDVCRSFSSYGPTRFYALDTSGSLLALEAASKVLAADSIQLTFTHFTDALASASRGITTPTVGAHADEALTSVMLAAFPDAVDMSKAASDFVPGASGALTRGLGGGRYSPSGVWGDATLASYDKGEKILIALEKHVVADIDTLRRG